MITTDTLPALLKELEFKATNGIYSKTCKNGALLKVDLNKKELIYPEDMGFIINEKQTCNFSANENFVVFECVHRLFEKGYKPEHIELEPRWKLGHGASGGRADILIKNEQQEPLIIIECKTPGTEHNKEWTKTQEDGGQLFSYAKQDGKIKYLCLYSSDWNNNKIKHQYQLITLVDNKELLKNNETLKGYSKADSVEELYAVWKDTYQTDYATQGLFEKNIQPYKPGKLKFNIDDLQTLSNEDIQGKYNQFATILRAHNVSGRENAFDKLINLFLCKVVDERDNPQDLKFFWKGISYDNAFDLQDRLQQLYQKGMKDFLNEEVTYIDKKQIDKAFRWVKEKPDATKKTIEKYFKQLKFFTNNDFAFIDVHNEKLFYQNFEVFLKIVRLFENISLKGSDENQFLGDLFEGFLDQGIKQSEGQFFTPMPIVKFIVSALPLQHIIDTDEIPQVIDYACGAGHFLNEYANQIKPILKDLEKTNQIETYYKNIYGIEKEYRLSKVSKISAFMYGQDNINIIYTDALAKHEDIKDNAFSILVANPPYSVKGFLNTLKKEDRDNFSLIKDKEPKSYATNNNIQLFFIERAKQLLKPGGVTGIILPSSVLSNASDLEQKARALMLKYFDLIAIVEFGSNTFGKTGTNTVTLFLRKKEEDPSLADHYQNQVDRWFEGDFENNNIYQDENLIRDYCTHLGYNEKDYFTLLKGEPNETILSKELFIDYKKAFDKKKLDDKIKQAKNITNLTGKEREETLHKAFIKYLKTQEEEKLYFFMLSQSQANKVLVIKCPSDNAAAKKFLGYEWSGAKGNEGIKYIGNSTPPPPPLKNTIPQTKEEDKEQEEAVYINEIRNLNHIQTPLFNPSNLNDEEKLNNLIRANFLNKLNTIPEGLSAFASLSPLADMLDFTRVEFNKTINLNIKKKQELQIKSKWEPVKLGEVVDLIESGTRPQGGVGNISSGALSLGGEHIHPTNGKINISTPKYVPIEFFKQANRGKIAKNDILICKDGALTGKIALLKNELDGKDAMVNEHLFILRCLNLTKHFFIFNFLLSKIGQGLLKENITGSAQGGLNSSNLKNIKIPLPPLEIQQSIVTECEAVDQATEKATLTIATLKAQIETEVSTISQGNYEMKKLWEVCEVKKGVTYSKNDQASEITNTIILTADNITTDGHLEIKKKIYLRDSMKMDKSKILKSEDIFICFSSGSKKHVGKIAYINTDTDYYAGGFMGIIRINKPNYSKFLFNLLNVPLYRDVIRNTASGSNINNLSESLMHIKIPVPPLSIQEALVKKIEAMETEINKAQDIINKASTIKQGILDKYLN